MKTSTSSPSDMVSCHGQLDEKDTKLLQAIEIETNKNMVRKHESHDGQVVKENEMSTESPAEPGSNSSHSSASSLTTKLKLKKASVVPPFQFLRSKPPQAPAPPSSGQETPANHQNFGDQGQEDDLVFESADKVLDDLERHSQAQGANGKHMTHSNSRMSLPVSAGSVANGSSSGQKSNIGATKRLFNFIGVSSHGGSSKSKTNRLLANVDAGQQQQQQRRLSDYQQRPMVKVSLVQLTHLSIGD